MADLAKAEWCAVQVYGSCEKAVASLLTHRGIEHFLPLQSCRRIYRGRTETVSRPFYEGYLFAAYRDEHERHEIRRTRYVADLIAPHGHREEVLSQQIEDLRRVLEIEPIADSTPWAEEGREVIVTAGAFQGIRGTIIKRHRKVAGLTVVKDILCVGVLMLGRVVEVEIDPAYVEPL
jgi:transcription antitermination factor NusG